MKNNIKLLLQLLAALSLGTIIGCTTVKNTAGKDVRVIDPDKISKLAPALESTVSGAVIYAYSKDKNSVKYISAIKTALDEFILSPDLNINALRLKIYSLPIKELKTPEAALLITPVLAAYKAYGEQAVKAGLDPNVGFKDLIKAMSNGISAGEDAIKQLESDAVAQ